MNEENDNKKTVAVMNSLSTCWLLIKNSAPFEHMYANEDTTVKTFAFHGHRFLFITSVCDDSDAGNGTTLIHFLII